MEWLLTPLIIRSSHVGMFMKIYTKVSTPMAVWWNWRQAPYFDKLPWLLNYDVSPDGIQRSPTPAGGMVGFATLGNLILNFFFLFG